MGRQPVGIQACCMTVVSESTNIKVTDNKPVHNA